MYFLKLNILMLLVLTSINFAYARDVAHNCLETIQLNPGEGMSGEDTANFVSCIMYEAAKRDINVSEGYYEKLSKIEKEKYDEMFLRTFGEIIEGERVRRALQSSKLPKRLHGF